MLRLAHALIDDHVSRIMDHGYGDIGLMMWTHVGEHGVGLTHSKTMLRLLFCMCHQLFLSVIPTGSLDLRSPLFLTVCSGASWAAKRYSVTG